jgi:4-hydroxyphenylpyruvate dioxygenase
MTMKPALAQVCSLNSPFESDIEDYAAGKCSAIELWLGKLEGFLETYSAADVRRLLDAQEMIAPVASYQGGLLLSQGAARREHWGHFERRLALCRELGVQTLVVAGDLVGPMTQQDLERGLTSLKQAAQAGAAAGVRIAVEFQSQAAFGNNLQTAAAIVDQVEDPNLGICLDAFHYYCGPSKPEDLGLLSPTNLFHVQLCDLLGQPRELATDGDRLLPGDGDIPLEPLVEHLRRMGYEGYVSIEVMNPLIWQTPPRQFGEIAMTALRRLLGQASMT